VAPEGTEGRLLEPHGAAATLGLRGGEHGATLRRGERAAHPEGSFFEVDIIPLQTQEFALPKPRRDSQDVESFETIARAHIE